MAKLERFHPPAFVDDFKESKKDLYKIWDEKVNGWFHDEIKLVTEEYTTYGVPADQVRVQFYNPKEVNVPADQVKTMSITWVGFPKKFRNWFTPSARMAAFAAADEVGCYFGTTCRQTDEYCEWRTDRNAMLKVTRVTFTCEGPEYWQTLAENDPDLALKLYRELVSPLVKMEDLYSDVACTTYDPNNKWNTWQGIVHLSHPANKLGDEVDLAARSTIVRRVRRDGTGPVITDNDELIAVAAYGNPFRASDPSIGGHVNMLARLGLHVTLRDPVGLYMDNLDTTGFQTPDGTPAAKFFTVVRGHAGGDGKEPMIIRATFEVPEGYGYTVGDIKIGGIPIQYGGQIAEHLTMKLTGIAYSPEHSAELSVANGGPAGYWDKTCTPGLPPHPISPDDVAASVQAHLLTRHLTSVTADGRPAETMRRTR